MLRDISNRIRGRRLSLDEIIGFDNAMELVASLNGARVSYVHDDLVHNYTESGMASAGQAAEMLRRVFVPLRTEYFEARLQVYSNGKSQKHYIDFYKGIFIDTGNGKRIPSGPIERVRVEYFRKNHE